MSQIHIIDGQEDVILDYVTADFIIDDNHEKSLENTLETYDFRTFADKRFSQFLEKRNRIIIPDEDESLREFIIFEAHRYRDSEGHKSQVFAHASYLELKKASIIYPNTFTGTPSQHGGRALNDTGWQIGIVEVAGNRKITINEHTNPYEVIKRIAKEFGAELRFRIEHDGNKVIGRYIDLLERVGMWRGREVEFGKDLDGIRRVEKQDVVTALLGLGPEKEDGTRLEVLEEDEDALQRWGRIDENGDLKHLIEAYEIQSDRTEMTEEQARQYTRTALNKRINTQVTFETTIVDLESVAGMENKKIRFGDTIKIKDEKFNPPLYLEARVFEMNRSIKRKDKTDIKLGDYIEHTEEQVNAIWSQLQDEIRKRFERMVIANIDSNAGDVFKNGIGSTELFVRTFVGGAEVDEDGAKYDYQWMKFDKDGNHVTDFYDSGKTLQVNASDIAEKATYRVLISIDMDVVNITEITLSNVFDGEDGGEGAPGKDGEDGKDGKDGHTPVKGTDYFDGVDGQDGQSSYLWIRYSQNENGDPMTTEPLNAKYIGVATTQTPNAPSHYNSYTWSLVKGTDGVPGETGDDGKTSYLHIKYSNDGGNTFTGNNGEDVGDWIGTYVDFTQADSNDVAKYTWNKVKGEKGDQGERGVQGLQGKDGSQGIPGAKGADGKTSYTHIAYADNAQGGGFSQSPTGKAYVGMYVDFVQADSNDASKYKWSLIKGADGSQGIAGPKGADGKTPYFHTAWANNATGTSGFSTTVSADKLYIGTYTDFTQADSTDPSKYKWTKIKGDKGDKGDPGPQGIQGPKGANGTSQYVHIRYSANANGNPMTTTPAANTQYIGLANTTSATAPSGYASYSWAKFKGEQGNQGIAGAPGANGQTTYTWVKYADNAQGSGMSDSPDGKLYIGLAFNKTTATESNVASQYDWSMMPQNIEIGGRNYLLGTSKDVKNRTFSGWSDFVSVSRNSDIPVKEGEIYTFSAYLESDSSNVVDVGVMARLMTAPNTATGRREFSDLSIKPGEKRFATVTFTVPSGFHYLRPFTIRARNNGGTNQKVMYSLEKLERGNVTTDWTPAPEDADQAIQDVKTTADGKNSIFYATAQPATTGRKIGDVWFKTNADNKMYRFNGSTWVEALIGEQAIVANSITANHIKSLYGLNVNNQFVVDNNGNVSFKGNLTGASGTFSGTVEGAAIKGSIIESTKKSGLTESSTLIDLDSVRVSHKDQFGSDFVRISGREGMVVDSEYGGAGGFIKYFRNGIDLENNNQTFNIRVANQPYITISDSVVSLRNLEVNSDIVMGDKSAIYSKTGYTVVRSVDDKIYLQSNDEVRAVRVGATGTYTDFRAKDVIAEGKVETAGIVRKSGNAYMYVAHNNFLQLGDDSVGGRVVSKVIYDRTYSSATNLHITGAYTIGRVTSASKYKLSIEKQYENPEEQLNHSKKILDLSISDWFDKSEAEILAEECFLGSRVSDDEFRLKRHTGLIAEDVERVGLKEYVSYGDDGEVEGIAYERLWTHLIPIVKDLTERVEELESRR